MSLDDYTLPEEALEPPQDDAEPFQPRAEGLPDLTLDRGLPSSVDAERTILGAILLDPDALHEAREQNMQAGDFSLDSHRRIYARMCALSELQHAIDLITVSEELDQHKELQSIGGPAYLSSLTEGLPRRLSIEDYVRIVKGKSLLRQMIGICTTAISRAADEGEEAIEIASSTMSQITEAVEIGEVRSEVFDSPTLAMDAVRRLLENPKQEFAIPTGFRPLDEFTSGGIRLGELWVVGASPSRGKTTLARQIVKHVVRQGIPSYVHSGEMSKESWYDVTACLLVSMPAWKVREPWLLNAYEKDMLRAGLKELSTLPFHISDAGGIHIDKLIWNASRALRQHEIKLFVIDYAQIINAHGKDPREKVSTVAQKLRVFAKDNNVATILLSQSPRPEGRSINSRPNMFSLKESGTLEEAAHCVILPFRPVDTETNAFTGEDELVIGKNRWGAIGSIPCRLEGKYLNFVERNNAQ